MYKPSKIKLVKNPPSFGNATPETNLIQDEKSYLKQLKKWQSTLLHIQQAYYHQGHRALIVFEGWDASGKGGTIRRLTEKLDPRGFRVYPISAPKEDEHKRHYLYRFQTKLPRPGTVSIFDRSYYGRVLVERIEGLASEREWQRAYQEINEFERLLIDDGVEVIKLFLHITPNEQLKRFEQRLNDPTKHWKLTEDDIRNRGRHGEYLDAAEDMFQYTSTKSAPWHLIASDHKWFTRVEALKYIAKRLKAGIDIEPPPLDEGVVRAARKHLGIDLDK